MKTGIFQGIMLKSYLVRMKVLMNLDVLANRFFGGRVGTDGVLTEESLRRPHQRAEAMPLTGQGEVRFGRRPHIYYFRSFDLAQDLRLAPVYDLLL